MVFEGRGGLYKEVQSSFKMMAALERLDAALDRICMGPKAPEGPKLIEIKCSTRPESVNPKAPST